MIAHTHYDLIRISRAPDSAVPEDQRWWIAKPKVEKVVKKKTKKGAERFVGTLTEREG